jgi:spore coat protein X
MSRRTSGRRTTGRRTTGFRINGRLTTGFRTTGRRTTGQHTTGHRTTGFPRRRLEERALQAELQQSGITQYESESVVIRGSSDVRVRQIEAQLARTLQLAVEAAVQSVILRGREKNVDVSALEAIAQRISTLQYERERVVIEDSANINVSQVEAEIASAVQAAIELLRQISQQF